MSVEKAELDLSGTEIVVELGLSQEDLISLLKGNVTKTLPTFVASTFDGNMEKIRRVVAHINFYGGDEHFGEITKTRLSSNDWPETLKSALLLAQALDIPVHVIIMTGSSDSWTDEALVVISRGNKTWDYQFRSFYTEDAA